MNGKGDKWRGGWSKEYEENHNKIFKKDKKMKYINQCHKCNQDFEHTEIIETIAVSTGEDSWEEVVYCRKCKPMEEK